MNDLQYPNVWLKLNTMSMAHDIYVDTTSHDHHVILKIEF